MTRSRLVLLVGLPLLSTVLVAGCSSPPEIRFGSAQPSGQRITLPSASDPGLPGAQWPDACTLLSDAEVKAVLPQAEDFTREKQSLTLRRIDFLKPENSTTEEIPAAGCDIWFRLPDDYDGRNANIDLFVLRIAGPSVIEKEYRDDRKDKSAIQELGRSWGADDCYSDRISEGTSPNVHCRLGRYYFRVSGHGPNGRLTNQDYTDKVLSQVVQTLAARMR